MSLTIAEARDEILTLFRTGWVAAYPTAPILWADRTSDDDLPTDPIWCRATVLHTAGFNDAIGNKIFGRSGTATIQIFTRYGSGLTNNDVAAKVALDTFQGQATPGGVWFRDVTLNEVGQDGDWFQSNVLATFEYTERL
jgi:hypothetical protein